MKKKVKVLITCFVIFIGIFVIYFMVDQHNTRLENERLADIRWRQGNYSQDLRFHNNINRSWVSYVYISIENRLGQDKFIFVLSVEDALSYPDDVAVFWPSLFSHLVMNEINELASAGLIDLEEFSLNYPLTTYDLVYNWDNLLDLLWSPYLGPIQNGSQLL